MQYFRKPLALIFSLSFFLFSFLTLLPTPSHAAIDLAGITKLIGPFADEGPWGATKEFCDKRNGDLMNLETWYSGKCGESVKSSIRGEGVGFADIVVLQGMESVLSMFGPTYKSLPELIFEMFTGLESLKITMQNHSIQQLAANPNLLKPKQTNSIGEISNAISFLLITKPASSTDYISYISNNLKKNKIVDSAFAASPGYGFQALSPILPLWRAFRNIAYMLFAIAFVMYGIMIMFRIRVDAKATASIMIAIPNLVATLLLITFSYAIVGLLIDVSTIFMALGIDVLRAGGIITGLDNGFVKFASGQSNFGLVGSFLLNGIVSLVTTPLVLFNIILGGVAGSIVGGVWIAASGLALAFPIARGISMMVIVAFMLGLFFSYLKIFWSVIKSYLAVIIALIFSPIMLLGNVLPGSKAFSGWIMNIIANLAVFPTITFFLVLSYALMMQPMAAIFDKGGSFFGIVNLTKDSGSGNFWTPPMTSFSGDITGGSDVNYGSMMLALVGIGLLFMCSKYADMVLEALKVPPFKYGAAIGDALKGGWKGSGTFYNRPVTKPEESGFYRKVSDTFSLPKGKGYKP